MKVLNLQCQHGHGFEGWFGSEEDFQDQLARQLVACPLCGDGQVSKLPSAPRLNLGAHRQSETGPRSASAEQAEASGRQQRQAGPAGRGASPTPSAVPADAARKPGAPPAELQALWLQAVQQVMARTEDVGERFTEEARRIHYGESPERGIRGQATPEQRAELAEEGIEVMPLPLPAGLKGPVQ